MEGERSKEIAQWRDEAMFEAAPMLREEGARVKPRVFLLSATVDPLGVNAAAFRMYAGKPTYDLGDITDEERKQYWEESLKTHLKAPWEFIDLHFFIEGVTRAFTHQMVRQRTAVYAQESLRFAVKEGFASEVPLAPGIVSAGENAIEVYTKMLGQMEEAYMQLVNMGVPAEDARGLLPHCVTTRLNYKTNFRNLVTEMGKRLCTQAQFEWRSVALGIMLAIKNHASTHWVPNEVLGKQPSPSNWQWKTLATPLAQTFTPVCYQANKCVFMGRLDRGCTIRDRVIAFSDAGIKAEHWGDESYTYPLLNQRPIDPAEWMANPFAGITEGDNMRPEQ